MMNQFARQASLKRFGEIELLKSLLSLIRNIKYEVSAPNRVLSFVREKLQNDHNPTA